MKQRRRINTTPGVTRLEQICPGSLLQFEGESAVGVLGQLNRRLVKQVEVRSSFSVLTSNFSGVFSANFFSIPVTFVKDE